MRKQTYLFAILFAVLIQNIIKAQQQSILLPFSGDTYPIATGTKMLNFTDPLNSFVNTLPKYAFDATVNGITYSPADPHIESHLQNAIPNNPDNLFLFNEKYLGQHPMFAQQVVHDGDGKFLFFFFSFFLSAGKMESSFAA